MWKLRARAWEFRNKGHHCRTLVGRGREQLLSGKRKKGVATGGWGGGTGQRAQGASRELHISAKGCSHDSLAQAGLGLLLPLGQLADAVLRALLVPPS